MVTTAQNNHNNDRRLSTSSSSAKLPRRCLRIIYLGRWVRPACHLCAPPRKGRLCLISLTSSAMVVAPETLSEASKILLKIVGSDENYHAMIRPSNGQGNLRAIGEKFNVGVGQNRRAFSTINKNIVGAPPLSTTLLELFAHFKYNVAAPVPRPITRKFAAQMASKQEQPVVECVKFYHLTTKENGTTKE